jgi:hypothetical protein
MAEAGPTVRQLLDAYPWAGATPRLELLGFDVALRATDRPMVELLTELYAPMGTTGESEHVLSISSTRGAARTSWDLHLDGTRLIRTAAPSIAFQHLLWEANRQAIDQTHDLVLVHASAAVVDDTAIVMPGPMGAGKSTLVAGLVRAGATYLTDEVVAIDPATGLVRPYPKYLSLGPALADLVPERDPWLRSVVGDQQLVAPDSIRPGVIAAPALPRLVVAPRYERGARAASAPLGPAAALSTLAQHAFHLERDAPRILATLTAMVERSSCFELVSGDVDAACDQLIALVAAVREPARS